MSAVAGTVIAGVQRKQSGERMRHSIGIVLRKVHYPGWVSVPEAINALIIVAGDEEDCALSRQ
jgi:hypothetical protein